MSKHFCDKGWEWDPEWREYRRCPHPSHLVKDCPGYCDGCYRDKGGIAHHCPKCQAKCSQHARQEDNTGHPTAETPDAQPLGNVSGEQLGKPVDILARAYDRVREVYLQQPMNDALGWALAEIADLDFPAMKEFGHLPEALSSNNASEADQSPSSSEQEDKPTTHDYEWRGPNPAYQCCRNCAHVKTTVGFDKTVCPWPKSGNDLEALLATEYDRGQADKALEQAQKWEKHMATAYDRGKVEVLEDLLGMKIYTPDGVAYIEALLAKLKAKGEVNE